LTKLGNATKVIPVITFVYVASTKSVSVAAEGCTEDMLWPFLDIGRAAAEPVGELYSETIKSGRLNRRRQAQWIDRLKTHPNSTETFNRGR
jgi:hypothetical protein